MIGLGDPTEVCEPDPFFEQAMPRWSSRRFAPHASAGRWRRAAAAVAERGSAREADGRQLPADAGRRRARCARHRHGHSAGHTFGSGEHVELARWVQLGMTPAEAIVAATSRPAALMGQDLGTLAVGKRASFIVLDANPLDDIRNTRRIADVYSKARNSIATRSAESGARSVDDLKTPRLIYIGRRRGL